ncbi:Striatin family-domain-containing protein [Lipomyces tetrasporus]|uniref:Striatin family-domain-containing protein n=1 Tax=Lipomyces tetrasporus TaxID=54092 RepID=A0AAD7R0F5_9ASCO|nr:Striatin family-domain-containing protein [Lipomyces tetrasporus]KAJ8104286.1 Striatin family-domain-containing protein [Lipomyces tetrasporus]
MSGVVSSNQQQSAEYTLQGVMRFLQTEWQKNERDRIQWEIEKAEMKARIARLEGEKRGNERLIESFVRRINMLEKSLADERAKAGNSIPEVPGEAGSSLDISNFRSTLPEDFPLSKSRLEEIEKSRAKSREYLDRCLQEVTYLLVFAQSVPAPQPSQPLDIPLSQMQLASQQSANSNNMARENGDINRLSKAHDKENPRFEDRSGSSEGSTTSASSSSSRSNSSNSTGVSSDRGSLSPGRRSNNRMGRIIVLEDNVEEDKPPRAGLPRINTDMAEESEEQGAGIIRIGEPIVSSSPVDENESWEFEDRSSDANPPQYVD